MSGKRAKVIRDEYREAWRSGASWRAFKRATLRGGSGGTTAPLPCRKPRHSDHASLRRWTATRDDRRRPQHMTRREWRALGGDARLAIVHGVIQ